MSGLLLFFLFWLLHHLFAPDPSGVGPAWLFLLLCAPQLWRLLRLANRAMPDVWELYGRDGMAVIDTLESDGFDEDGTLYIGRARLVSNGRRLNFPQFSFPDDEQVIRSLDTVPVRYLPDTGMARIQFDLLDLVLDCRDPSEDDGPRAH